MGSAADKSLTRYWISLPEALRARLRLGFTGKRHLLDIAAWCLGSGNPDLFRISADALTTVIRENPLDGALACDLLALEPARALLDPAVTDRLTRLAGHWRLPDNLDDYRRLQAERDFDGLKRLVRAASADQPGNLFWIEQGVVAGCMDGDTEFVAEIISKGTINGVEDIINAASRRMDALSSRGGGLETDGLAGRVAQRPWDAGLALLAHDVLRGVSARREPLPGSVAVLVYSWNKAGELAETLASLAESDLAGASLFVLDNGSTDRAGAVLQEWSSRFEALLGAGRFTAIFLPVNIGAPAARNWLLHREDVRAHEFICYLDDDVELPPDWLALARCGSGGISRSGRLGMQGGGPHQSAAHPERGQPSSG